MMHIKHYIFAFLVFAMLLPYQHAHAGWPIGKRHYVISSTLTFYKANKGWNRSGQLTRLDGSFTSQSAGLFFGYGITRGLDIIASVPYSYQTIRNDAGTFNQSGAGDLQVGFSGVLKNFNYSNYITLYIGGSAPLYKNTDTRVLGIGNAGVIARLSNSGSLSKSVYYNVNLGGAQYFGPAAPTQGTADVLVGFKTGDANQINLGAGGIYSSSSDKTFSANTNAGKDFWYSRVTAGWGHSFSKRFNMNVSGFYIVAGKNTGQAYGASLSANMKLPYFGKKDEKYLR